MHSAINIPAYEFTAQLWRYPGDAAWYFVTLPVEHAREIKELTAEYRRGFGSVRVIAEIAGTSWKTSIFPDKTSGSYVLPVKVSVRKRALIEDGDTICVRLRIEV